MKKIEVLTGPPGCGKSDKLRELAIAQPGLYLFCAPTIPLIKEQVERFRAEAPHLQLYEAHCEAKARGTVQRKLDDAREKIFADGVSHAVVFATHEALMMRDLSGFAGWHIRIDEAPNATKSGSLNIRQSQAFFAAHFDLEAVGDTGWSAVSLRNPAQSWKVWNDDDLAKPLVDFCKLAGSPGGAFVKATDWATADKLDWWFIWTPASLREFDTVTIAGSSYHSSLGALISTRWFGDKFEIVSQTIGSDGSSRPKIQIHYFTQRHEPSTTLWGKSEGRRMIKCVREYMAEHVPDLGYWSGNREVLKLMEWTLSGEMTDPKVAGRNEWRNLNKCAIIYSSRVTPSDRPLQDIFGITDSEISRSREDEDILQFAMRGAVRNPGYSGDYDVYLYSKRQAERLSELLTDNGLGGSISLIPVDDAGIMEEAGPANERRKVAATSVAPEPAAKLVLGVSGAMIKRKSFLRREQRRAKAQGQAPKKRGRPAKVVAITLTAANASTESSLNS